MRKRINSFYEFSTNEGLLGNIKNMFSSKKVNNEIDKEGFHWKYRKDLHGVVDEILSDPLESEKYFQDAERGKYKYINDVDIQKLKRIKEILDNEYLPILKEIIDKATEMNKTLNGDDKATQGFNLPFNFLRLISDLITNVSNPFMMSMLSRMITTGHYVKNGQLIYSLSEEEKENVQEIMRDIDKLRNPLSIIKKILGMRRVINGGNHPDWKNY